MTISLERLGKALAVSNYMLGEARLATDPDVVIGRLADILRDAGISAFPSRLNLRPHRADDGGPQRQPIKILRQDWACGHGNTTGQDNNSGAVRHYG